MAAGLFLRLLVGWVLLSSDVGAEGTVALGTTAPTATFFMSQDEFDLAIKKAGHNRADFALSRTSIALATELLETAATSTAVANHGGAMKEGQRVGPLTFPADRTGLPLHVALHSTGGVTLAFKSIALSPDADPTGSILVRNSDVSSPGALSITFRTSIFHDGGVYQHLRAAGLHLTCERPCQATFVVSDPHGTELSRTTQTIGPTTFVGFLSSGIPLGSVTVVFTKTELPDVALHVRRLVFSLDEAYLMDGVPPETRTLFWIGFHLFIAVMLALDLLFFLGRNPTISLSQALFWSLIWVVFALAFDAGVFVLRGRGPALVWLTAYLLERFLSIDNLFVFLTLFAGFHTPVRYQHKVLTWGIASCVLLRALFIFTGVALVERFASLLVLFGLFLVYAGVKALRESCETGETELDHVLDIKDGGAHAMPEDALPTLQQNPCLRLIGLVLPMTTRYDPRGSFFVHVSELGLDHGETLPLTLDAPVSAHHARWRRACGIVWSLLKTAGRLFMLPIRLCARVMTLDQWHATPLFAVLVVVETTDVVFAADSIPAVLSITQDPFIAYTSNIFAVLGLRTLYFALASAMSKFTYLSPALGVILLFIGGKLLAAIIDVHVTVETTLVVVLGTLFAAIVASVLQPRCGKQANGSDRGPRPDTGNRSTIL